MYLPHAFEECRIDVLHQLIREYPLGTLITVTEAGLDANHLPFEVVAGTTPYGTLHGHVARANSVWRDFARSDQALVIFQGPEAYISPSWLPTKAQTGKVVPTWNYAVVHAHGTVRAIEDRAWLRSFLEKLTAVRERGREEPWRLSDAPAEFIEKQLEAIVGIEMTITRMVGKWKTSQNRSDEDRAGVVRGLAKQGDEKSVAMAGLIEQIPATRVDGE